MSRFRETGRRHASGFTLVEAIITIVITGILTAIAAVFIRAPITAYQDVTRRAELTDIADTALRRIAREVHAALPNSTRVAGTCTGAGTCYLEFVPIKSAGRYRESGPGNPLDFTAAADTFDVIGPGVDIAANDAIVIYNLGVSGSDVYDVSPRSDRFDAMTPGTALTTADFSGGPFPFSSPARRFHVVGKPVTYACNAGAGQLQKYSNYAYSAGQLQPPAGMPVLLATNVSSCSFTYQSAGQLNSALVTMALAVSKSGETVSLVHQVHVNNAP